MRKSIARGRSAPCSRAGLTMVELTMIMMVLLVAVGGTLGSISSFVVLSDSSWERSVAYAGAQRTIEEMQAQPFHEIFARYNTSAADDPAGAQGASFAVAALNVRNADADGMVGRIVFPVDPAAPTQLREDLVDDSFGFPRDLTGDGVADGADHADDYQILPVQVRVEWRGKSGGNRFVEVETVLRPR